MAKLTKVYLSSGSVFSPERWGEVLADLKSKASEGFRVELQREVLAHTKTDTLRFTVCRIEPPSLFYGEVDTDTEFEQHAESGETRVGSGGGSSVPEMLPAPPAACGGCEVIGLKGLIDDLEAVRIRRGVTYEFLHKVVEVMKDYGWETGSALG